MLIALSGKMGAGKNAVYEILKKLNPKFKEIKFATPIYNSMHYVQSAMGLNPHKDGKLLQLLGEHYREQQGLDFFAKMLFKNNYLHNAVITDLRMPNEFNAARAHNFKIVRVNRDLELRKQFLFGRDPEHPTEIALNSIPDSAFDFVINNNYCLARLNDDVKKMFDSLCCLVNVE